MKRLGVLAFAALMFGCATAPTPSHSPRRTVEPEIFGPPSKTAFALPLETPAPLIGPAVNGLVTYPGSNITFEYPAEWRVVTGNFLPYRYWWVEAVLGTGGWILHCYQIVQANGEASGMGCGGADLKVAPGQVEVEITIQQPPASGRSSPPPEARTLVSGVPYTVETSGSTSTWKLYAYADSRPIQIVAEFGSSPDPASQAQVDALVASIRLSLPPSRP